MHSSGKVQGQTNLDLHLIRFGFRLSDFIDADVSRAIISCGAHLRMKGTETERERVLLLPPTSRIAYLTIPLGFWTLNAAGYECHRSLQAVTLGLYPYAILLVESLVVR